MAPINRRLFLGTLLLTACDATGSRRRAPGSATPSTPLPPRSTHAPAPPPAPACAPTLADIEGPFYKAGAPGRTLLEGAGVRLQLRGVVRDTDCRPLHGAQIEMWHADHRGAYDDDGFDFRTRFLTGADGSYQLDTILPGRYLNGHRHRPAHIHAKLAAYGFAPLTTQLYFPGDPYNDGDPFFKPALLVAFDPHHTAPRAHFDFVLGR